ncbi:MAG: hypothetical protein AAFP86_02610 [Planctomycetota bacterium]
MSRLDEFNPADGGLTEPVRPRTKAAPSPRADELVRDGIACLCIWASGSDVELDGVVHVAAARRGPDGAWEGFEESTRPFAADGGATARILSEFGVDSKTLSGAPTAAEVWPRLRAFVGSRPVLCHDAETCEAWARQLDLEASVSEAPLEMVGLDEIASLLEPGFLSSLAPSKLVEVLVDAVIRPAPRGAILPPHVLSAAAELVARFGDRFRRVRRALYDGDAKVVVGSDGSLELYELTGDPGELSDLAETQPGRASALARELARWTEEHRRKGEPALPADLTPSQRRDLGALGYGPSAEDGGDASKER